jgi:hypothetical protein
MQNASTNHGGTENTEIQTVFSVRSVSPWRVIVNNRTKCQCLHFEFRYVVVFCMYAAPRIIARRILS